MIVFQDVLSVAFSVDNRQIVSGSRDKSIKLWNTLAECKYTIQVSSENHQLCCFSLTCTNFLLSSRMRVIVTGCLVSDSHQSSPIPSLFQRAGTRWSRYALFFLEVDIVLSSIILYTGSKLLNYCKLSNFNSAHFYLLF